jgi:fluoride exporter
MTLTLVLGVALLGAVGCVARWALTAAIQTRLGVAWPVGTFVVNALGSIAIGVVMGVFAARGAESAPLRVALTIGFMGGFTTMSSFAYDTVRLLESRSYLAAALNVFGSVAVCLIGCAIGLAAGRAVVR